MSASSGLLAIVEVAISVHNFVNIEVHFQGWYALRFRVPQASGLKAVWPASVVESEANEQPPKNMGWALEPSGFRTRIFRIGFCFEEVKISETFSLHLYFSKTQDLSALSCIIDVELLFQAADTENPSLAPSTFNLKSVCKESICVKQVTSCTHEHYGCTFNMGFFGLANMAIITTLQGYTTAEALHVASKGPRAVGLLKNKSLSRDSCNSGQQQQQHAGAGGSNHFNQISSSPGSPRLGPPASLTLSTLQRTASHSIGMGSYGASLVPEDQLHLNSLLTTLQALIAASTSPAVVGSNGHKCGSGSLGHLSLDITAKPTPTQVNILSTLYDTYVGAQLECHKKLQAFLRSLPKLCFMPQSYEVMRTLLSSSNSKMLHAASAVAEKGAHLNAIRWQQPASSIEFFKSLPVGYAIEQALQELSAAIHHIKHEVSTDWQVLLWVLQACPTDMHRYLKCNWQLEQPKIVDKWLAVNTCMSDEEAQATMAATMRLQMKMSPRFEIPLVHNVSFWELPHSHPIFHIDDSLAQYPPAPRSDKFPPSASATPDTSPQRPVAHPKPNQEGSSEALRKGSSSAGAPTTPRGGAQMPIQRTVTPPTVSSSGQSAGRKGRSTIHAIIFVHGFQGNSTDMCLIKGNLSLLYPNMECYSSRCNEENTSDSLQEMGSKLACEVADYLKPHASSTRRPLVALSFVGHSLGNLIIRSALTCQELKPFLHLLHLYVSLSGPHLGNLYSTNTVLDTGISVLKSVSGKGKCLHQLSFTDASNIQDCFLYRLAQKSRLADFKYIMLVTSPQDRYVPYHSARLSKCLAAVKDPKRGPAYNAMLKMLLQDVGEPDHAQLIRIDVDFDFKNKSFSLSNVINSKIGRQAHIELLLNSTMGYFLAWTIQRYKILNEVDHAWI